MFFDARYQSHSKSVLKSDITLLTRDLRVHVFFDPDPDPKNDDFLYPNPTLHPIGLESNATGSGSGPGRIQTRFLSVYT